MNEIISNIEEGYLVGAEALFKVKFRFIRLLSVHDRF